MRSALPKPPVTLRSRSLAALALHAGLPLALAGAAYVLFRSRTLRYWGVLDAAGIGGALDPARAAVAPAIDALPEPLLFSLPDALWLYALIFALGWVQPGRVRWLVAGVALGAGVELAQLVGVVGGTFDPVDLVLSLAAAALAWRANKVWEGDLSHA